jgi:ABC-type uncharacterized transport system substrate-binding protein
MTMMRRTIGILITFALGLLVALQAVEAQPAGKVWRFSFLALTPGEDTTLLPALLERLHELGYREGQNLTFAYRSADGQPERLPPLALELVRARPDVLISGFGSVTARALKAATTTIPIVFTNLGDPVGTGLVERDRSARAGGSVDLQHPPTHCRARGPVPAADDLRVQGPTGGKLRSHAIISNCLSEKELY